MFAPRTLLVLFGVVHARFLRYEPSPWEQQWLDNIDAWRDVECDILAEPEHRRRAEWLIYETQRKLRLPNMNARPKREFDDAEIYSKFHYCCDDSGNDWYTYIEPLVGILRDPLTMCNWFRVTAGVFQPTESFIRSKRWLLIDAASGGRLALATPPRLTPRKRLLFDIGASLYHGWARDMTDAVGAKWFVDRYAAFNLTFDLIYAFEADRQIPRDVFANLPDELLTRYVYYNVEISSDPRSVWNLWRFIAHAASPDDHVTVKLDMADREAERELFAQLLASPRYTALVDEMFYEHHVNTRPMHVYWSTETLDVYMNHSYANFLALRRAGVRMHSWP